MRIAKPLVTGMILLSGCAPARRPAPAVATSDPGQARFDSYCAACHLSGGTGGIGEAPPLEEASWVAGPAGRLVRIVLQGLHGPVQIAGRTYNQEMPAFGKVLSDADAALLVTYVRRRFAGVQVPVSTEAV